MTAYRYVPSTPGEVVDLLGAMFLRLPRKTLANTDLGVVGAFGLFRESLEIIRPKLGEERYRQALDMSHEAEKMYNQDDVRGGGFRLKDIRALISKRG